MAIEGDGFTDPMWQRLNGWDRPGGHQEYFGLTRDLREQDCDLIVRDDYVRSHVTKDGHLTAAFRVGKIGNCFQQFKTVEITPGVYNVVLLFHACAVGTFRVTR
jgi:hypothetical protein